MAGRPRKPTAVLELSGAFDKNPKRRAARADEPVVTEPLGLPPSHLTQDEAKRWADIEKMCPWLRMPDRIAVERTAHFWQRAIDGEAEAWEEKLLQSNLIHLGMFSADRSKVQVPGGKVKSSTKFGEFRG